MNLVGQPGQKDSLCRLSFLIIYNKNDEVELKLSTKFGKNDIIRLSYLVVQ